MNRPNPLPSMRATNGNNEFPRSRKEQRDILVEQTLERRSRKVRGAVYFIGAAVLSSTAFNVAYDTGVLDAAMGLEPKNEEVSALARDIMDNESLVVRCDDELLDSLTPPDEESVVAGAVRPIDNSTIYLREKVCDAFELYTEDGKATSEALEQLGSRALLASYIEILGHEGVHTEGIMDEAQTSCYSIQRLPGILESLGYSTDDALVQAQAIAYQRRLDPPQYLSTECRPGGEYDLSIDPVYIVPEQQDPPLPVGPLYPETKETPSS